MKYLIIISILSLAACSSTHYEWSQGGRASPTLSHDLAECDYQTSSATFAVNNEIVHAMEKNKLFMKCMDAKGYQAKSVPNIGPDPHRKGMEAL
jgi:hypothetical protein